eukprot:14467853-Alexandrium_andersonii.AAC.1
MRSPDYAYGVRCGSAPSESKLRRAHFGFYHSKQPSGNNGCKHLVICVQEGNGFEVVWVEGVGLLENTNNIGLLSIGGH